MKTLLPYFKKATSLLILMLFTAFVQRSFGQAFTATWAGTSSTNAAVTGAGNAYVTGNPASQLGLNNFGASTSGLAGNGWPTGGIGASNYANYFQYSVTATSASLAITSMTFSYQTSGSVGYGGNNWDALVYYSLDNFNSSTQIGSNPFTPNTGSQNFANPLGSITVANGQTLSIRVYAGYANNANYYFYCKNFALGGTATVAQSITTGTITGSPFCVTASSGASVSIPFTSSGTFSSNTYTAQLSSSTGSFASPTTLGTLVSNANSGSISGTIPAATATGTGYIIRVISNGPSVTGSSSSAITINYAANSVAPTATQNINASANGTALTVTEQSTPTSRQWYYGTVSGGPYGNVISGATGTSYTPNFSAQGAYYVVCVSTFACSTVTTSAVQVNVTATVTTGTIGGSPYCVTASTGASISVPFTSAGTFSSNTYTAQLSSSAGSFASPTTLGTLVSNANSGTISGTIPAATATGTGYLIRVISSSPSITGSSSSAITINYAANSVAPTAAQNINTSTSGTTLTVTEQSTPASRQWYYGTASGGPYGNAISGATSASYIPNFASAGTYYVVCKSVFACTTIISNEVQIVVVLPTITTGTISGSPFCVTASSGAAVSVPFTSAGNYSSNTYTAQLSSSTGSFASPTTLGTLASNANSGTISGTIPAATATGAGYLIRVISNSPSVTGTNSSVIAINYAANSIAPTGNQTYAAGANGTALSVTEQSTATSRQWYYGTVSGTYNNVISGATGTSYTPNFTVSGTYYVVCKSTFACATVTSNAVQVVVNPGSIASLTMSTIASPQPVDASITPSVTITGKDAYGNLVNGGTINITTTAGSITPASVTLSSSGTVTVSNFVVTVSGSNQTITATSASNSSIFVVSNMFTVSSFVSYTGDYFRSNASGDWATAATWQGSHDGTNWYSPATLSPTSSATSITVMNTHNITVTSAVTGEAITVNAGGIININSGGTLSIANGSGTDLTITGTVNVNSGGTLANSGAISSTTSSLLVNSGGTYQHTQDNGAIPSATWNTTSTCYITGVTANAPSGLTAGFGNFRWNCTGEGFVNDGFGEDMGISLGSMTINGNFTLNSTGSSFIDISTLTVKGSYSQTGGSLADISNFILGSTTGTLNVAGDFNMSGGVLGANSAYNNATLNVNFNGTSAQKFIKSAGSIKTTNQGLGGTLTNNFTVNNGAIVDFGTYVLDGSANFTLSSGGSIITANTAGLTSTGSTGSIQVTGTRIFNSGASYTYDGGSAQHTGTFTTTTANTVANMTINNKSGVILDEPLTVTGTLYLTNGLLTTTSTNLISLSSTASTNLAVSDYTNTSYVNGPIQKIGTTAFTFPVGKSGIGYVPIGISSTSASQTFRAEYIHSSASALGSIASGSPLQRVSSCDYWNLNLYNSSGTQISSLPSGLIAVTLYWNQNNSCNVIRDLTSLAIGHFSSTWDVIGLGTYTTTGNTTNGSITYAGASNFSPFALATTNGTNNPLPITVDYFTATKQVGYNKLTWKVECTSSSSSFDVERSYDGSNFEAINTVKVSSATDCALPFVYDDYSSNGNKVYYRIKMVDIDDNAKYSNIELISNDANAIELMSIQPNPVYGDASLKVSASGVQNVELAIIGIDGKQMQHKTIQVQQGTNNVQLNTGALAKGIYFVKGIFANGQTNVIKFVKQ